MKQYFKNKIRNFIIDILNYVLNSQTQNIKLELAYRALKSTADYVEKNMKDVISVDSKYKVHDIAINNVTIENGIVLEFGVYKGDTLNYIAKKLSKYDVYGFDSFEGLPEFWRDGFPKEAFALNNLPQVEKNVKLIKGLFEETLPLFVQKEKRKIAYLHIDCDVYSSTKTVFNFLKNQIVSGTVIVFDEYFNYPGWEDHEYKAFQEFIKETGKKYKYLTYNSLHEQVALIII
ncbi:MAG: TylF/MycF family methyltransferase [Elusimicrobiota bacterium]